MNAWDLLGLQATRDVIAIKRAYAAKLRITRPDDNAHAYQLLRSAYEWALQFAATASLESHPGPRVPDGPPTQTAAVPVAMANPSQDSEPAVQHPAASAGLKPADLVNQTLAHWQSHGDDGLAAYWPTLRSALCDMPMWQTPECNLQFAQLVLDQRKLPASFVEHLAAHFEWGNDYRQETILGRQRAIDLRMRLTGDILLGSPPFMPRPAQAPPDNFRGLGWMLLIMGILLVFRLASGPVSNRSAMAPMHARPTAANPYPGFNPVIRVHVDPESSQAYARAIANVIRPYLKPVETGKSNPRVIVTVTVARDGNLRRIETTVPSGSAHWDAAVMDALNGTPRLPRDENGNLPKTLTIEFWPRA